MMYFRHSTQTDPAQPIMAMFISSLTSFLSLVPFENSHDSRVTDLACFVLLDPGLLIQP